MKISSGQLIGSELGVVSASLVSSKVFYKDFFNSVRNFFGWELKSYTEMLDTSRDTVIERMVVKAELLGANGMSNLKFEVSYMANGSLAILGYATAMKVKK